MPPSGRRPGGDEQDEPEPDVEPQPLELVVEPEAEPPLEPEVEPEPVELVVASEQEPDEQPEPDPEPEPTVSGAPGRRARRAGGCVDRPLARTTAAGPAKSPPAVAVRADLPGQTKTLNAATSRPRRGCLTAGPLATPTRTAVP